MPFALGFTPQAEIVSRDNSYLYVAGPGAIYAYAINSDGSLSAPNSGSGVAVVDATSLDISPDGKWLFALDAFNSAVDVYQILANGNISILTQLQYQVPSGVVVQKMLKVSPNGSLLFAALGTGGIAVYTFNTSTGILANPAMLAPLTVTTSDNALAVDSTDTHLYVARSGTSGGLWVYNIGAGGTLQSVAGSPFPAGAQPSSVLLDSTGKYVYVANGSDNTISGYSIGATGNPAGLSNSPFGSGHSVRSLAIDRTGSYLLASALGGSPDLTLYSFDASVAGKLDSIATAASGTDPAGSLMVTTTHP